MIKQLMNVIQPLIIFIILVLLTIWNTVSVNFSVNLVYWMLVISAVLAIFNNWNRGKGSTYIVQIIHLFIFGYLAWAFLVIGSGISKGFLDMLFYILLLLSVWFGLGYTAYRIKKLMNL